MKKNKNMKKVVKINENTLRQIVAESTTKIINEHFFNNSKQWFAVPVENVYKKDIEADKIHDTGFRNSEGQIAVPCYGNIGLLKGKSLSSGFKSLENVHRWCEKNGYTVPVYYLDEWGLYFDMDEFEEKLKQTRISERDKYFQKRRTKNSWRDENVGNAYVFIIGNKWFVGDYDDLKSNTRELSNWPSDGVKVKKLNSYKEALDWGNKVLKGFTHEQDTYGLENVGDDSFMYRGGADADDDENYRIDVNFDYGIDGD